ncbi:S-adenosyl-L-methionine-dependent methyltransferase [Setomelanomma holmii]|uniref:S-adenosyl-L-methionine-dependent methyltransferase n=1 Tax=Setomelanomma holmii TaxID=210430 RepID=A0A9P4H7J9_9PLEO|nr:S-adenosyl-L-methionine-dependent methyltransferase [Setomelanomma holmii]
MATQNQDRLRTHFSSLPVSSHAEGWDALWKEGTFIPWDRGCANPALVDLLASPQAPPTSSDPNPTPGAPRRDTTPHVELPSPLRSEGKRLKALVPGCGKGYDVALFASWGYDAYGLEVSEHAALAARKYLGGEDAGAETEDNKTKDDKIGRGVMEVVVGDYFDDGWSSETGVSSVGEFDVIYDNTFLCALPPDLRPRWAERTASLLAPNGILICLEFPTHKPVASAGPPWSLPPTVHQELLKQPGKDISYDDKGAVVATDRPESAQALVRVAHWVPKRTHPVGVVNGIVRDCVSVWKHKMA